MSLGSLSCDIFTETNRMLLLFIIVRDQLKTLNVDYVPEILKIKQGSPCSGGVGQVAVGKGQSGRLPSG